MVQAVLALLAKDTTAETALTDGERTTLLHSVPLAAEEQVVQATVTLGVTVVLVILKEEQGLLLQLQGLLSLEQVVVVAVVQAAIQVLEALAVEVTQLMQATVLKEQGQQELQTLAVVVAEVLATTERGKVMQAVQEL